MTDPAATPRAGAAPAPGVADNPGAVNDRLAREHPINDYYDRSPIFIRWIEQSRLAIIRDMVGHASGLRVLEVGSRGGHVAQDVPRRAAHGGRRVIGVFLDTARDNLAGYNVEFIARRGGQAGGCRRARMTGSSAPRFWSTPRTPRKFWPSWRGSWRRTGGQSSRCRTIPDRGPEELHPPDARRVSPRQSRELGRRPVPHPQVASGRVPAAPGPILRRRRATVSPVQLDAHPRLLPVRAEERARESAVRAVDRETSTAPEAAPACEGPGGLIRGVCVAHTVRRFW